MLPNDEYYACTVYLAGTGLPTGAVITFGLHAPTTTPTPEAMGALVAPMLDDIIENLTPQAGMTGILVKQGPDETGPSAVTTHAHVGSTGSQGTPANFAALVTKNTVVGGRKGKGRFFLPCIDETQVTAAGLISAEWVANLQTDLNAFLVDLDAEDIHMVVLHQDGTGPYAVTSLTASARGATQRRRQRR